MTYQIECCHVLQFFFNDTATTEIYTLSLHDALPIFPRLQRELRPAVRPDLRAQGRGAEREPPRADERGPRGRLDRKSTRLNSSHANISYAVFCLKKKESTTTPWIARPGTRAYSASSF